MKWPCQHLNHCEECQEALIKSWRAREKRTRASLLAELAEALTADRFCEKRIQLDLGQKIWDGDTDSLEAALRSLLEGGGE